MKRYQQDGRTVYDIEKDRRALDFEGQPWKFVNLLPLQLDIFRRKTPTAIEKIATLPPVGTVETKTDSKGVPLSAGDLIHIMYKDEKSASGPYYEIAESEYLRGDSRTFKIGDIVYETNNPSAFSNLHTDISGFTIHNMLTLPIEMWHHGHKLSYTRGNDGKGYLGGSVSVTYIDNDNHGFRLGDEIEFRIPYLSTFGKDTLYAKILLVDNFITDIHVGRVSQFFAPPPPDTYTYRADARPFTGMTYFRSERHDAYSTRKTNPLSYGYAL